jgi:hypothetical protein
MRYRKFGLRGLHSSAGGCKVEISQVHVAERQYVNRENFLPLAR